MAAAVWKTEKPFIGGYRKEATKCWITFGLGWFTGECGFQTVGLGDAALSVDVRALAPQKDSPARRRAHSLGGLPH